MALKQENRLLSLKSPLGENVLLLISFQGREEVSRLFEYQLDMISDNANIKAADIVGKSITVGIDVPESSPRFFNGIVNSFVAGDEDSNGRRNYVATIVPWLWFLTQTADCRIFQKKKIPDILEQIYQDLGFSDFEKSEIKGNHKEWEYCVQYRETDFQFVSRLMEQEGIHFYFRHEDGKHTLVMGDQNGAFKDLPEKEVDYPSDFASRAMEEHIKSWEHRYSFRPGKWAQTDYNFKTPSTSLMAKTNTIVKLPGNTKYEVYDYPGEYPDKGVGDGETKLRMEEEEAQHDIVNASSNCKTFSPGGKFKIRQHRSSSEEGKTYVILSIQHMARETLSYETGYDGDGVDYQNLFNCIPDSVPFRPARTTPKPIVQGVQTAIIVGPGGEEIYTDEFGRVKVQFHWDREGKKDENSSCWMRVSQIHAGRNFGGIDIPRIGDEVIVSFLEGDPDRPIITGRVYHAENMPPFGLPDKKVICGIKTKTYKGDGYNEMIMDDTPGNELIRVHGQYDKDSTIEHDLREHVLNNRSRDVTVDETIQIGNNKTVSVGVNHTETIGSNMSITVGSNLTETVGINYAETVGAAMQLTVGAFMSQTIGAAYTLTVGAVMSTSVGANQSLSVGANQKNAIGGKRGMQVGGKFTEKVGGNVSQQYGAKHTEKVSGKYLLKSGATITLEAANKIVLKTGSSSITMTSGGDIKIQGTKITIEGTAKIMEKSAQITSEASAKNVMKGAMVNVEASAINTIKGSLVKIN